MTREKRPDDTARELAPEPTEPVGTRRTAPGVVKYWLDNKGHGAIASEATAPWDIWFAFSAVEQPGGIATLPSGEQFPVTRDEDGRVYLPSGEQLVTGYVQYPEAVSMRVGERVEVIFYRADHESFKYVARRVRRLETPDGAA
jgi:cold shock CspA family protein